MATIELYANKINRIPGLVTGIRNETSNLKSELMTLKTKVQSINQNICNVDDVMASISASTQTQEDKIDALNKLEDNVLQFTLEAEKADSEVAEAVKQNKNKFYEDYSHLKPNCEKTPIEIFIDGCQSASEWCVENWEFVVTVALVAVAVVALVALAGATGPFAAVALLMAKGVLTGALSGGLIGGGMSMLTGGSFWEGFKEGAFEGAISGLIFGAFSAGMMGGANAFAKALIKAKPIKDFKNVGIMDRFQSSWMATRDAVKLDNLGEVFFCNMYSSAGASLAGDFGDIIKGENISGVEVVGNATISGFVSGMFSPSVKIPHAKIPGINDIDTISNYFSSGKRNFKTFFKGFSLDFFQFSFWNFNIEFGKNLPQLCLEYLNLQPRH